MGGNVNWSSGATVYSVYWHIEAIQVQVGQPVVLGQVIALVAEKGATCLSCNPCYTVW